MKVTYEHKNKLCKNPIETFNMTQDQMFMNKAFVLATELLDLYWSKDGNGEITISRKTQRKQEPK